MSLWVEVPLWLNVTAQHHVENKIGRAFWTPSHTTNKLLSSGKVWQMRSFLKTKLKEMWIPALWDAIMSRSGLLLACFDLSLEVSGQPPLMTLCSRPSELLSLPGSQLGAKHRKELLPKDSAPTFLLLKDCSWYGEKQSFPLFSPSVQSQDGARHSF